MARTPGDRVHYSALRLLGRLAVKRAWRAPDEIELLVRRWMPYARKVMKTQAASHRRLEWAEVESAVMFALFESAARYEPIRGVPFGSYFAYRASGAVRDASRQADTLTRDERERVKRGQQRRSDGSEIVEPHLVSLDFHRDDDDETLAKIIGCEEVEYDTVLGHDVDVWALMERLPERERLAVYLYYFEGLTEQRIGDEFLGITLSRVSQILARARSRMRAWAQTEVQAA